MSHAHRAPSRRRVRLWPVLVVALLVVALVTSGLWASSSLKDDDETDSAVGSAQGGQGLSAGAKAWQDMSRVRGLTDSAGAELKSTARDLSDDSDVQAAVLAVAWKATCSVIQGEVTLERGSIAQRVLDLASTVGVEFRDDGELDVADAVRAVVSTSANDAAEKCGDLSDAGF